MNLLSKNCSKCHKESPIDGFYRNDSSPDGLKSICKACEKENHVNYMRNNRDKYNQIHRNWRSNNLNKSRQYSKSKAKERREEFPWEQSFYMAKTRCNAPHRLSFERYGGRGIKFRLSMEEIKQLWHRDAAWLLAKPSLDRIDSNGDYSYTNCRFIELSENSRLGITGYWERVREEEKRLAYQHDEKGE